MFGFTKNTLQPDTLLNHFINQSPIAMAELDTESYEVINSNEAFRTMLHLDVSDATTDFISRIEEADRSSFTDAVRATLQDDASQEALHHTLSTADKHHINAELYLANMTIEDGQKPRLFLFVIDITEQKNLEMRFAHSQKMQAVGQLAGGVAHDFNNLLTAMIGFCDLLLMRHPAGDPSFADIMQVKQNANRAANLVRQLLAFSRRQTLQPKRLNLTDLLAELTDLLRRLIGENIELGIEHQRDV